MNHEMKIPQTIKLNDSTAVFDNTDIQLVYSPNTWLQLHVNNSAFKSLKCMYLDKVFSADSHVIKFEVQKSMVFKIKILKVSTCS